MSQKISCKATRKQHLNFWKKGKNLWERLWLISQNKASFLKGDRARDWETVWLSRNFKILTLHHGHTQQEYFGKLNPSISTCKHGEWTTVPLCRCVQLRILVTDLSCRFEGNEQIFKQLLNFQLTTTCYAACYQMPFWWKSRFRQLTVLQLSNQTTSLQTPKGFSKS